MSDYTYSKYNNNLSQFFLAIFSNLDDDFCSRLLQLPFFQFINTACLDGDIHTKYTNELLVLSCKKFRNFIFSEQLYLNLINAVQTLKFEFKPTVIDALAVLVLDSNDEQIKLLAESPDAFNAIWSIEAEVENGTCFSRVMALCRIAETSHILNNTVIKDIVFENEDFVDWINEIYDVTSDPEFAANKDPDIVDKFNMTLSTWLLIPPDEEE